MKKTTCTQYRLGLRVNEPRANRFVGRPSWRKLLARLAYNLERAASSAVLAGWVGKCCDHAAAPRSYALMN
jgi:hypothetical protein